MQRGQGELAPLLAQDGGDIMWGDFCRVSPECRFDCDYKDVSLGAGWCADGGAGLQVRSIRLFNLILVY